MRAITVLSILVSVAALAGCATSQQWAEWQSHPAHFASDNHIWFSLRNRDSARMSVTRADVERARSEAWWGQAVTVDQAAIQEN